MKIKWQPWRNPLRPWRVESEEIFTRHTTSRGPGPDAPFWCINTRAAGWLEDLPPIRFLWREYEAVQFVTFTTRKAYMPHGDARMVTPMPKIPPMWFARKSDILMFKLAWGGSI